MSLSVVGVVLVQLLVTAAVQAQEVKQTVGVKIRISEDNEAPNAVVLSVTGKCEYSEDGVSFAELTSKQVFKQGVLVRPGENDSAVVKAQFAFSQGAVVRTGADSRVDIFFRRIGTTVRLQADTEVKFEKMSRTVKGDVAVLETLLDLRKGRIFTVVRSLVAGSTFEIRNAAGRSVVEGAPSGSMGRYIITADGSHVADKSSTQPIKLVGEKGITIITPGQEFDAKEGKLLAVATPKAVATLIEFDELQALAEGVTPPVAVK